jgi:hypothetical protein
VGFRHIFRIPENIITREKKIIIRKMATTSELPGISLQVTVTIAPENVPKFFELFKPVYEKVIEEPDCTFFEVYISPENPGVLSWVENWYLLSFFLFYF